MIRLNYILPLTLVTAILLATGCETTPKTAEKRDALGADVEASLAAVKTHDPSLDAFLGKAYGYAVFPSVGKGGWVVGGAYGRGQVFEQGKVIGFAEMSQATIGLQAGGQEFAEIIAFENKAALDRFINKNFELAAQASAVALKSGAAASAKYTDGVAVFTHVKGGLMLEAAVGGQKFTFAPIR